MASGIIKYRAACGSLEKGGLAIETKKIALGIAAVARKMKAQKVVVLDMRNISGFCDYFVISSANSLRQVNALARAI